MERKLFNWNGFDVQDTMVFSFYDCTLVQPIGPYAIGEVFNGIFVDYETGNLSLYKNAGDDDPVFEADLKLVVV